jgi:hypothetical protein
MTEGVDYSFGRPGGAALKAAGKVFAVRYLSYTGDGGKGIHAIEVDDLHAHGVAIAFVFESIAGRARGGHDAGAADGRASLAALTTLGVPTDRPAYFAVDFNATPNDYPLIDAYLAGAAEALGASRIGVYGEASVVDHCKASGSARWFWQTYAWSGGIVSGNAHLLQYRNSQTINGAAVDFDRSLKADFGQWPKPVATAPLWTVVIRSKTPLFDHKAGTQVGAVSLATYTATRTAKAPWWYQIVGPARSKNIGKWFPAEPAFTSDGKPWMTVKENS